MNEDARRTALRKIPYGVNVVTVKADQRMNGFAASWISQCSFSPPMIMLAIKRGGFSYELLDQGRVFVVNILDREQAATAEKFFHPVEYTDSRLAGLPYVKGVTGVPILKEAAAYLECEVERIFNVGGDHDIVVGRVVDAGLKRDEEPLTLAVTGWQYGG
jgi:flavin reductase (DIM6/NTAB) family NADH-FMN oxidoreductase RutF